MDSVFLVGQASVKYRQFLERIGYHVVDEENGRRTVRDILEQQLVDIVIVEGQTLPNPNDLIQYIRSHEAVASVPIVVVGGTNLHLGHSSSIEHLPATASPGILASKVATLLRLRKMDGKSLEADIGQMNAALRDYTDKMQRDIAEAQAIQHATLPSKIPKSEFYEIAYCYEPLEELGGDWFSVWEDDKGGVSLLIADVTGHGLAAAFIGGWITLALHSVKTESPAECVKAINKLIEPLLPEGRFITMTCARYDPKKSILKIARAGHPPSFLYRALTNKTVLLQEGGGFAVGFIDDLELTDEVVSLDPGDLFLLMTDGILEATNLDSAMYGTDGVTRFFEAAAANHIDNPQQIIDRLRLDVKTFTNDRIIKDDITALVLKRVN